MRLSVHQALVNLASANDELDHLALTAPEVEKWLSEWDVSAEEKTALLKTLVEVYAKSGDLYVLFPSCFISKNAHRKNSATSYQYQLSYVRSIPHSSSGAEPAAVELIATALRSPTIFDFDPLFRLDAVVAAKDHELFALLQVFLNDGLAQFQAWESSHADSISKYSA